MNNFYICLSKFQRTIYFLINNTKIHLYFELKKYSLKFLKYFFVYYQYVKELNVCYFINNTKIHNIFQIKK